MRRALAALALATVATASPSEAPELASCAEVRSLIRVTRARENLTWVPTVLRGSHDTMTAPEYPLSAEQFDALGEATVDAYSPQILADSIRDYFEAHCDAHALTETLAWFRSPVGIKVVRGEMDLVQSTADPGFGAYLEQLSAQGITRSRIELSRDVQSASLSGPPSIRVQLGLTLPPVLAARRLSGKDPSLESTIAANLTERLRASSANSVDTLTLRAVFALRNVSETELQEHLSFLRSKAGRWYSEQLKHGFEAAVDAAGKRLLGAYPQR